MAYNWNNQDDYKQSEFNSAALKMMRLNKIQDTLNQIHTNLLNYNSMLGEYNYVIKLRMIEQLYQEVESKLTEDEREDAENLHKAVRDLIDTQPVFTKRTTTLFEKSRKEINHINWKVINEWLFKFESKVRELIDKHGMDTRYAEDDEGL